MNTWLPRYGKLLVSIAVSIVALYLASRSVDYSSVWSTLSGADGWLVGMALASVALNTLGKAVRWHVLMGETTCALSVFQSLRILLIGQMLNTLVPARLGDLSRVYLVGKLGMSRSFALGTIAIEKILDMVMYSLLFFYLILLMPVPEWVSRPGYLFGVMTGTSLLVTLLITRHRVWIVTSVRQRRHWLPGSVGSRMTRLIDAGLASTEVLYNQKNTLKIGGWSGVIWATAVLTNYLVLQALHIDIPVTSAILVLIVLQVGISIPSVPGRIGIFEYLCVLALAMFQVDPVSALSFGILLHAVVFVPSTIAGLLSLWGSGLARQPALRAAVKQ